MSDYYIEYIFKVQPKEPTTDILIAELGQVGFDSFVENENGVAAYIKKQDWNEDILQDIYVLQSKEFEISYQYTEIAPVNWNSEWEKNFQPIQVRDAISVRAPFHPSTELPYEIVIEPKMSFGTGHHETTHAMLEQLLEINLEGKQVLDMGCGTGILAIFSKMKGASTVDAIDIDKWCYENTLENVQRNNCDSISVYHGDASLLLNKQYDVLLANINRNILLKDMSKYVAAVNSKGILVLSGFYEEDMPVMQQEFAKYHLEVEKIINRNHWVSVKVSK